MSIIIYMYIVANRHIQVYQIIDAACKTATDIFFGNAVPAILHALRDTSYRLLFVLQEEKDQVHPIA